MARSVERTIAHGECERCGSIMDVRTRARGEGADIVLVVSACPGCKRETIHGFTTELAMRVRNRRHELMQALERRPPDRQRRAIIEALHDLELIESRRELGL